MTKGRPADPARARRQTGNRPKTTTAPLPVLAEEVQDVVPVPSDLAPAAQEMFRRVVSELQPRGLREADLESVAMLCHSAWLHSEARKKLGETGILVKGPRGPMVNPLVKVVRDEAATYLRLADAFGLTLASRLRLGLMQLTGESILSAMNKDLDRPIEVQLKV